MTMLRTPYNFVQPAPFVLCPEWGRLASHDHPFADGLSGELRIELRNYTLLCLGGKQEAASEQAPGKVFFYRTPDGQCAIPGSSLKGMLRAALAPVVFARFNQLADRKLSVRDISKAGTYYHDKIVKKAASAGWLRFNDGRWQLQACRYVRIRQKHIIEHLRLDPVEWKSAATAESRYSKLLSGMQEIRFDCEERNNLTAAVNLGRGEKTGTLVVTGQPGATYDQGKRAKKWEFVFYDENSEWHDLDQQVLQDFLFVHADSAHWEFLLRQGHGRSEIPVFFHGTPGKVTSFGLAMMYRLAQKSSLHDAVRNISSQHLNTGLPDLVELLFGRLRSGEDQNAGWGLRGRVNIGLLQASDAAATEWTIDTVLSSPKPGFHPAYLQQDKKQDGYVTLDSRQPRLQGWKRYPVKPKKVLPPPVLKGVPISNKVKVRLETLKPDAVFSGKIRFHNLRPVELGALLWILDFGGQEHLRHALGMGKPYGLGQVGIKLIAEDSRVVANDRTAYADLEQAQLLAAARRAFTGYMDDVWHSVTEAAGNKPPRWEESPQVINLRAMANPKEGERSAESLEYMALEAFKAAKGNYEKLQTYADATTPKWATAALAAEVEADSKHDLAQALAAVEQDQLQQQQQLARQQELRSMTPAQRLLAEADEMLSGEDLSETQSKNVIRKFNELEDFPDEALPALAEAEPVLARADGFGKKKLSHAVKKLRNRLAELNSPSTD